MTETETEKWWKWFDYAVKFSQELLKAIDNRGSEWSKGLDRGWFNGFLAGTKRMIYCVDLSPEDLLKAESVIESLSIRYGERIKEL